MPLPVPDAQQAVAAAVEMRTSVRRRRKRDTVFEASLTADISLWANVSITRGRGGAPTAADLWVGVRHHEIERLVAEASERPISPAGTIIHPVFELVGDARTYRWWSLREDHVDEDAADLADALADPGLAWAGRLSSLEAIAEALANAYRQDLAWWRLPAALLLLGRASDAEAYARDAAAAQSQSNLGEPGELTRYWQRLQVLVPT